MLLPTIKEIKPGVIQFHYDNNVQLGASFLRLQEYYESISERFFRKKFQFADYIIWYASENDGEFSYFDDYTGFNINGEVVKEFFQTYSADDLSSGELLMKSISDQQKDTKFCFIGTCVGEEYTIPHEVAHAMFYLHPEYKRKMLGLVRKLPKKTQELCKRNLKKLLYNPYVMEDEIHAYMSTSPPSEVLDVLGVKNSAAMQRPFKNFYKKWMEEVK